MAYKDFPSERTKVSLQMYKQPWAKLSDEQKMDVKQGLKDNFNLRNPQLQSKKTNDARRRRPARKVGMMGVDWRFG